jgi:predicted PurR-regulated permease PerM
MSRVVHIRLDAGTAVRVVGTAVITVAVIAGLDRGRHLIAWLLTAVALALVLDGPVRVLTRGIPRAWAVAAVTVTALLALFAAGYAVTEGLIDEYQRLRRATPGAAGDLADWLGLQAADAQRFVERAQQLVDEGPERLLGSPRDVTQGTLSNLAIFAIVVTLAVFLLAAGTRITHRAASLVAHIRTNATALQVGAGMLRGAQIARRRIGHVAVIGLVVAVTGALADVPGSQPLGLWVALWRLLPLLGILVGYAPFVSLLVVRLDPAEVILSVGLVLAAEVALTWWSKRHDRQSVLPLRTVAAVSLLIGFELYGAVGALVAFVLGHVVAATLGALLVDSPDAAQANGGQRPSPP